MCCGKINMEDMKKLSREGKLKKEQLVIPKFMENMDEYMRALDIIAETNHIDDLDNEGDLESTPTSHRAPSDGHVLET